MLPLDDRGVIRSLEQPSFNRPRTIVTYLPGMSAVPRANMLNFRNRSYSITAEVEVPPGGVDGVLLAMGGRFGGFSFFVQKNRLNYAYNWFGLERFAVSSTEAVPAGSVTLRLDFTSTDRTRAQRRCSSTASKSAKGQWAAGSGKFGLSEGLTVWPRSPTPVTEG